MDIRLVVFDVDGTLTQHSSVWWRLHELFGTTKEGRQYFDQYFAGEINYEQWADYDAALWTGEPVSQIMEIVSATNLVPGVCETVATLRDYGIKTAILSGGLDIMADDIARRASIEYVLTNKLGIKDGVLTGTVENIIGWAEKAEHIHTILDHFDISLEETAFVGDGRNDMSVLSVVGLSIAFNPEDQEVADAAQIVIHENDLRAILPYVISGFQR
ncbi:MAG: HAD family hydrolase [Candidatus Thorarchaeota archaeon]|nr:MAG: HAD family hydrolase [Candidatus Thorarchaeota archaeon]